ncbi:MFS transporter [Pedobacter sp. MW01-1-1]|uniref:MFS transporter n=1 Tax=Pedobacter sp. MW01-1-1 TaxID=3383027 RepID=UPI003FEDDF66
MNAAPKPKFVLPIIVICQFLCTSLWFAGNAIMPNLLGYFPQANNLLANLTSMIQFGFISGTFVFALLSISDRFSPSQVFVVCALTASICNLSICYAIQNINLLMLFRFLTGFMLAGIYPVGMKIAADYFKEGLGKSLGFLVGALVFGTAFPHLLKTLSNQSPWQNLVYTTSALSALGGIVLFLFIPDGPHRLKGQKLKLNACLSGFKNHSFKAAAYGYFGHMWELYTFWAFLPVMLQLFNVHHPEKPLNTPLLSFLIIASGGLSCILGGLLSQKYGAKKIATIALTISGICCLLSPLLLFSSSHTVVLCFLFVWGLSATADSPLFSSLVAKNAPDDLKGTSLTVVNCIGFAITIISIQVLNIVSKEINPHYLYTVLALGPIFGLIALRKKN